MHPDEHVPAPARESGHLSDDQLLEICFPLTDERHLSDCEACRFRYDGLVRALAETREDAVREADAVFTADRLAEQRAGILRRLERSSHHADVVAFPARAPREPVAWRSASPSRRWIAAAAAAGLVAGLLVGRYADLRSHLGAAPATSTIAAVTPRRAAQPAVVIAQPGDDEFLVEIEDAVTSRRVAELQALDALTSPELREISLDGSR